MQLAFFTEGAVQLHVVVWALGKGVVRGSEGGFVNQELSPGIGFAVIGDCVAGCAVTGRAVAGLFVAGPCVIGIAVAGLTVTGA